MLDVVIVGGGPAGLNAALLLGRARRRVLVCDTGAPRNAPVAHLHGFLSRDGLPPSELGRIGREQLGAYPSVELRQVQVAAASPASDGAGLRSRWPTARARRRGGHPDLVRVAYEAGVTVLAGTDSTDGERTPHGRVAQEIRWLAQAGVPAEAALAGGSWTARRWLGLPGLEEGAPADVVAYAADPRQDVGVLEDPVRVILRGRMVR
jgi:flavin-dependent dehydrogenase